MNFEGARKPNLFQFESTVDQTKKVFNAICDEIWGKDQIKSSSSQKLREFAQNLV